MCANPAVPTDNHAASDNRARSDPAARSYLCSGLNHRQRSDLRRRIDDRPLRHNCGRVNTGRNWRHRIEQCSNARPRRVWFGRQDRHRCQLALAPPYQDAQSQHRPMSDQVPMHNVDCPEKLTSFGPAVCRGATPSRSSSSSSATPRAVLATTASEYGPLRRKNLALPVVASAISCSPSAMRQCNF